MAALPPTNFKQLFRTEYSSYLHLVNLIKNHSVFQNSSQNQQRDPAMQLAVALARFGSNGNGTAIAHLQTIFHIGHGTILSYTNRVIEALLSLKDELLSWPDKQQRLESSQVMQQEGFPGCVGFVDGTTIPLSQKPALHGEVYFDCKKRCTATLEVPLIKPCCLTHGGCG